MSMLFRCQPHLIPKQEVSVKQTKKDKATQFLFTLIRRGPKAFDLFIESLRETSQDFIADQLIRTLNEESMQS